ncbi:ABC transporter permease [Brevibacterium linens]|uniref:Transport permease protein n=2 Tax=Brevibacterium TaxID=1696 RepID=A0A2H1ICH6_BRELN|nr:ABC transporter permease [Brevibacterium linens]MDN5588198.1 ABC transporter permease [Brevibacterium sp.]MDN5604335.1 ABC transporter permease [Kocuria sp.]SMX72921.1 ABC-2 type transport system permease protein [Brevibacterium linens]
MSTMTMPTVHARRPGPSAWMRMVQAEAKMITRSTANLIVPLGLPILLLVMQGLRTDDLSQQVAPGVTAMDYYALPVVLSIVVTYIGVMNFPSFLSTYRKTKVLRRLAVTPASPAMVMVAQMVVGLVQVLVGIALAFGVAMLFFDASLPADTFTALLVLLTCCVSMYALGMIVASVAPTPNTAAAIGLIAFFAMAALGGMFGPMENLPDQLAEIGSWLPFGAAVEAFQSTWIGETVDWENWVSLGATTVLGVGVASALFRWE